MNAYAHCVASRPKALTEFNYRSPFIQAQVENFACGGRSDTVDNTEEYCFAGESAVLRIYSIDRLAWSQDPPMVIGVLDFQGGGRMINHASGDRKAKETIMGKCPS